MENTDNLERQAKEALNTLSFNDEIAHWEGLQPQITNRKINKLNEINKQQKQFRIINRVQTHHSKALFIPTKIKF